VTSDSTLRDAASRWIAADPDPATRAELEAVLRSVKEGPQGDG